MFANKPGPGAQPQTSTSRRRLYGWPAAWLALLIGEALVLSLSVDVKTGPLVNHPDVLVRLLSEGGSLLRLGICVGVASATLMLASPALRRDLRGLLERAAGDPPRWGWIVGHLATFALFDGATHRLLEGIGRSPNQTLPVLAWASCGVATFLTWCLAAMHGRHWIDGIRIGWKVLLLGGAVGLSALLFSGTSGYLWNAFHAATFNTATAVLRLFSDRVTSVPKGHLLGVGDFTVAISSVCSGYEGIGLIWAFLGGYLLLFRRELRFPQALLLLPIGTLVIWAANVGRICALILLGSSGHPEVALGGFHSQAGWLAFNAVGLGLVAASRSLNLFSREGRAAGAGARNPTLVYLGPMLAILATAMVTAAMSDGRFDRLYPLRVVAAVAAFWLLRKGYTQGLFSWSWLSVAVGILVFVLWVALEPSPGGTDGDAAIPRALAGMSTAAAAAWLLARVFGSVVTVPVAEELAFRGFLLRRLISADFEGVSTRRFTWPSLLVSSILFGAMHQRWLAGTLAGILYALAMLRRGEIGDAITAHATTNALIAADVLLLDRWSLWS